MRANWRVNLSRLLKYAADWYLSTQLHKEATMPTMDELVGLIQETEAGRNDVIAKTQAADAASAGATAAAQQASAAAAERDRAVAAQAAKVEQVLAMVQTLYGDHTPRAN